MKAIPSKRRKNSLRLQEFFYGSDGAYFVTICAKNRVHHFGEIRDGKMELNGLGKKVQEEWLRSEEIRAEVFLDEFCIMPNHFHGIVWIATNGIVIPPTYYSLPQTPGYQAKTGPIYRQLGNLINRFKGSVTRAARQMGIGDFAWQRKYHDRIIRNKKELEAIQTYIQNNPQNWHLDEWYS